MFQIKNLKKLFILALKVQTVLANSRLKEEKAHTKFLVKFKSTEKKKINKTPLGKYSLLPYNKERSNGWGEGKLFYLNFLYCESSFYVSLLLAN